MDDLISFLPDGDIQYVRCQDEARTWGVSIFFAGSSAELMKVAVGMDKSVAKWLELKLIEARSK